jgi:hypothetical protein
MGHKKRLFAFLITLLLAAMAEQGGAKQTPAAAAEATAVAAVRAPVELLPERLAGARATGEARQYGPEGVAELAGDKAAVYHEYNVISAAAREYEGARVAVFQMKSPYAAFGLFTYSAGEAGAGATARQVGSDAARVAGGLVFWKGNYFVRVTEGKAKRAESFYAGLASAVAGAIPLSSADAARPPLLDSLPAEGVSTGSRRYFLGPESFGAYFERARDAFSFEGSAEAVMAEYAQGGAGASDAGAALATGQQAAPLKFFIIEYHTPNFATDAMARAEGFLASLPDEQRDRMVIEREGNFIVGAINVADRDFAARLMGSVEYPYTVKWLRNPLWPTRDPFRARKAAEMLLSTFGLLGLMILAVLVGGGVFGSVVFLKRRKRQRAIFSDAGGMLRLDIDPFEKVILGLPPKRGED